MGACTKIRAIGPAMAMVIGFATVSTSLPATAGSGKYDTGPKPAVAWVSSALRPKGVPAGLPVTICVTGQTLSWVEGKKTFTVAIPDATVSFKPWESVSQTWYGGGEWDTSVPSLQANGKTFVTGLSVPLPAGVPRGLTKVKWRATFESDMPGITVQWNWSAAAYSKFNADFNALGVAPVSTRNASAGTPVAYGKYLLEADDDDDGDGDHDGCGHHHDHDDDDDDSILKSETFQATAPVTGFCGGAY